MKQCKKKKDDFIDYLRTLGFDILEGRTYHPAYLIKYFVVIAKK